MMGEVWAWVDEQRDNNREKFNRLLQLGRETWTPKNVFNRCCVKWLVDGPKRYDPYGDDYFDEYNLRNGCPGEHKCKRAHPFIALNFDAESTSTIATLSHQLDPFEEYFSTLVKEGKATGIPHSSVYRVAGYLRPNLTALKSQNGFGNHLIKVEKGAMEASDKAQTEELETKPSATKKLRIANGSTDNDSNPSASASKLSNTQNNSEFDDDEEWTADDIAKIDDMIAQRQSADLMSNMLEEVMGILLNERLHQDLQNDFLSLYSMRCSCKTFKRAATLIAKEKLKTLDLSVTPLVNGFEQYGDFLLEGYDSETCDAVWQMWGEPTDMIHYNKKEKVALAFRESGDAGAGHYPIDNTMSTYDWDSGWLNDDIDEEEDREKGYNDAHNANYAYRGQAIRVYWHPNQVDPVKAKERGVSLYGGAKPPLGICVASFRLYGNPRNTGNEAKKKRGVAIEYEVIECDTSKEEGVDELEEISDVESDEEAEDGLRRVVKTIEHKYHLIKYSGKVRIIKIQVDFSVLVREHAARVQREINSKHQRVLKERPLTHAEKEYKQFVATILCLK